MTTSLVWMEMPNDMLTGYQKVSHFYGQNFPMVVALGSIELLGALLLLIERTRLMGALIFVISGTNIILLDLMYQIYSPVPEAAALLWGSLYILYLEKDKLVQIFLQYRSQQFQWPGRHAVKNILKVSAVLIPCLIFIPNYKMQYRTGITGKYHIKDVRYGSGTTDTLKIKSHFTYLYFDFGDYFAFTSSDLTKRQVGKYTLDPGTHEFTVDWIYPSDQLPQLKGKIHFPDQKDCIEVKGHYGTLPVTLSLEQQEVRSLRRSY